MQPIHASGTKTRCYRAFSLAASVVALTMPSQLAGQQTLGTYAPSSASFPQPHFLTADCPATDQYGNEYLVPNCGLTITVSYGPLSNGHLHEGPPGSNTPHPMSGLSTSPNTLCNGATNSSISGYTDSNGYLSFTLCPTLVGQNETITLSYSVGLTSYSTSYNYGVGYADLVFANNPSWILTGATDSPTDKADTGHGGDLNNHWITTATYNDLVTAYNMWAADKKVCFLCVNDGALPQGGKFDIAAINKNESSDNAYHPWTDPHKAHDRGSAVDIAAVAGKCNYPVDRYKFLAICGQSGFNKASSLQEGNHVHCNSLLPGSDYPNR